MRDFYEQLYTNKLDNLKVKDKFLETYHLPRLNHEEIENVNISVASKEIINLNKVKPRTRWFHWWILLNCSGRINANPSQTSKILKKREYCQTYFTRPALYQNQTRTQENYKPIFIMNIYAEVLNIILANQIQQQIKRIIIRWDLFLGCKDGLTPANQYTTLIGWKVKIYDHLNKCRKSNFHKLGIGGTPLHIWQTHG